MYTCYIPPPLRIAADPLFYLTCFNADYAEHADYVEYIKHSLSTHLMYFSTEKADYIECLLLSYLSLINAGHADYAEYIKHSLSIHLMYFSTENVDYIVCLLLFCLASLDAAFDEYAEHAEYIGYLLSLLQNLFIYATRLPMLAMPTMPGLFCMHRRIVSLASVLTIACMLYTCCRPFSIFSVSGVPTMPTFFETFLGVHRQRGERRRCALSLQNYRAGMFFCTPAGHRKTCQRDTIPSLRAKRVLILVFTMGLDPGCVALFPSSANRDRNEDLWILP